MVKLPFELTFFDPRLGMSHSGRLLVRNASFMGYALLFAGAISFLISDVSRIRWAGFLLLLISSDRLYHWGNADHSLYRGLKRGAKGKAVNTTHYLTPASFAVLERAYDRALLFGGNFYLFILRQLADRKDISTALRRMDLNPKEVFQRIDEALKQSLKNPKYLSGEKAERRHRLQDEIIKIASLAFERAVGADNRFIEPKDIFSALSHCGSDEVQKILEFFNIDPGDLEKAMIFGRYQRGIGWLRRLPVSLGGFVYRPYKIRHRIMNRAWSARPTPTLDKFSEDLTDYARMEKIGFMIGHEEDYDRLVDILSRPAKPNVLLVGDPGSGKETIINHLAYKITKDDVPAELFDKRLVMLRVGSLISGATSDILQARVNKIIEEIVQAGNIIFYIPDIHNLVKTSGRGTINAADLFLPAFESSAFSVVGATYIKEYKQTIEPQVDFAKVFEVIQVEEISEEQAIKLLVYDAIILERQYRLEITFGAVKQAVAIAHKYFRDKLLPSSAEDLLKEALSDAAEKGDQTLSSDDIIEIAQRRINIPLRHAKEAEAEKLLHLEELIHERLIDQEEAVKAVSRSLREYRSGLSRKGGPIATFLFIGPTGVGKTELSKILTKIQFGSAEAMIRFDMTEYQDKQSIFRFIGSPDGVVSGSLTEAVLQKPYSLVLLDEFEKAHPDILNLFLQVFDDGRLTDNMGRLVDFQNTIIIATSNAHSNLIKESLEEGKPMSVIGELLKKKLTEYFRPELINRFSDIIVFKSLSPEDIVAVAGILLKDLTNDLKKNQGIDLSFSETAIKQIAEWGYDPVFGARPLRGVISDKIRSVLAEKILKNEIGRGNTVAVSLADGELKYEIS